MYFNQRLLKILRWLSEFGMPVLHAHMIMLCDDYCLFLKRLNSPPPSYLDQPRDIHRTRQKDKMREKIDTIGKWCDVDQSFLGVFPLSYTSAR